MRFLSIYKTPERSTPPSAATARGRMGDACGDETLFKTVAFIRRERARCSKRVALAACERSAFISRSF
jgi:hypothetical protein